MPQVGTVTVLAPPLPQNLVPHYRHVQGGLTGGCHLTGRIQLAIIMVLDYISLQTEIPQLLAPIGL